MRFVWNWALRMCSDDAYRAGERVGYTETGRRLTALKHRPDTVWLNEVASVCLQQAFAHFFDKRAAYPAVKRKVARQSANYTSQGFTSDAATRTLNLAKIGALKVRWSRGAIPVPSSVRLIRTASGRYFVSLIVDVAPVEYPNTGAAVGQTVTAHGDGVRAKRATGPRGPRSTKHEPTGRDDVPLYPQPPADQPHRAVMDGRNP